MIRLTVPPVSGNGVNMGKMVYGLCAVFCMETILLSARQVWPEQGLGKWLMLPDVEDRFAEMNG